MIDVREKECQHLVRTDGIMFYCTTTTCECLGSVHTIPVLTACEPANRVVCIDP